jgi:hypothetical protein
VPHPDPIPGPRPSTLQQFLKIFRLLALLSIVIAAVAVVLVVQGAGEVHASLIIATALGVGLTVLLGTGLMALMFISSDSGHDEQAARTHKEDENE